MTATTHENGAESTCPTCGSYPFTLVRAIKKEPKQRKPRTVTTPGETELPEVRKAIRIEMLAKISGCNRATATAVVATFPNLTFSKIMTSSVDELANIQMKSRTVGHERDTAIKNVVR